jgi:hypothetical protein
MVDINKCKESLKPFHKDFKVVVASICGYGDDSGHQFKEGVWSGQGWFSFDDPMHGITYATLDPKLKIAVAISTGSGAGRW